MRPPLSRGLLGKETSAPHPMHIWTPAPACGPPKPYSTSSPQRGQLRCWWIFPSSFIRRCCQSRRLLRGRRILREAEHLLAHDVALDLGRAAPDRVGAADEEGPLPPAPPALGDDRGL